jgi:hypothetical protein
MSFKPANKEAIVNFRAKLIARSQELDDIPLKIDALEEQAEIM